MNSKYNSIAFYDKLIITDNTDTDNYNSIAFYDKLIITETGGLSKGRYSRMI